MATESTRSLAQELCEKLFPGQMVRSLTLKFHLDQLITGEAEVYLNNQNIADAKELLIEKYDFELIPSKASNDCGETGSN